MPLDSSELFAIEESLHNEAEELLTRSGVGAILAAAGYQPVGSYVMRTMTWRDLDFELQEEEPDWQAQWEVGTQLARTGWFWRMNCVNAHREPGIERPPGLYWGLRLSDPERFNSATGTYPITWKMDLWRLLPEQKNKLTQARDTWASLITEEGRARILAIKREVCHTKEYRDTLVSAHIYEAVLECGIRDANDFREWWREKYAG